LLALSVPLAVASAVMFYDIADKEPFYGYPPAQLRRMMITPISFEGLWLVWCVALVAGIFTRRIHERGAFLLLWAALWMFVLAKGISQYVSDIAVLESPNRNWLMQHGKNGH
jgi:hypothetical protein